MVWLKRLPSEVIFSHIRFSTRPMEDANRDRRSFWRTLPPAAGLLPMADKVKSSCALGTAAELT